MSSISSSGIFPQKASTLIDPEREIDLTYRIKSTLKETTVEGFKRIGPRFSTDLLKFHNRSGETLLNRAIEEGNAELTEYFLSQGGKELAYRDGNDISAWWCCLRNGAESEDIGVCLRLIQRFP